MNLDFVLFNSNPPIDLGFSCDLYIQICDSISFAYTNRWDMAATATAPSAVRYAPEDHSLPKPWKGLVDDRTGYLYFWNPETNVTQYERPTSNGGYAPVTRGTEASGPKAESGSRFSEVLTHQF